MAEPPVTRPSLLLRLRNAADGEAWDQFVELYAPVLYRYFRGRGVQDADAADLTQEAFEAVATASPRFGREYPRGKFRVWLYGVARNKLCDFWTRRQRQPRGNGDAATEVLLASLPAPDEETWKLAYQQQMFTWAGEQVRACIDETTWQAFHLTAVEGKSGQEAARALGMSVGAVYVAKSRVLARLKQAIESIEGDEDGLVAEPPFTERPRGMPEPR